MKAMKETKIGGKEKIGVFIPLVPLLLLVSAVENKDVTPREVVYVLREEYGCEINRNGEENLILDYLAQVERKNLKPKEFLEWFKEWLKNKKERR